MHQFFKSHHFAVGILPIPGLPCSSAAAAFVSLSSCVLSAVSAQAQVSFTRVCLPAGALHSLQRLAALCDLVVVTSRQHCIREPTLEWIDRHFPGVFAEVHFGNHWALEGQSKAKSEICRCAA